MRPFAVSVSSELARMSFPYKSREIKRLYPILSDVEVIIIKKGGPKQGSVGIDEFTFVRIYVLKDFYEYLEHSGEVRIWNNVHETYQLKKRESGNPYYDDEEVAEDTYVAIVNADDIPNFIKESRKMALKGDEFIDPLDYGKYHSTEVYVYSPSTIPPNGFSELLSRSATVHLVINEEVVGEILKDDLRTQEQNVDKHVE